MKIIHLCQYVYFPGTWATMAEYWSSSYVPFDKGIFIGRSPFVKSSTPKLSFVNSLTTGLTKFKRQFRTGTITLISPWLEYFRFGQRTQRQHGQNEIGFQVNNIVKIIVRNLHFASARVYESRVKRITMSRQTCKSVNDYKRNTVIKAIT